MPVECPECRVDIDTIQLSDLNEELRRLYSESGLPASWLISCQRIGGGGAFFVNLTFTDELNREVAESMATNHMLDNGTVVFGLGVPDYLQRQFSTFTDALRHFAEDLGWEMTRGEIALVRLGQERWRAAGVHWELRQRTDDASH
jgi:hypothetical protein